MKKLLCGVLAVLSLSTFAQVNNANIERRLDRLNKLVFNEQAHLDLSNFEHTELLRNINDSIRLLSESRGGGRRYNQEKLINVTAIIESTLVEISGNNTAEVLQSCNGAVMGISSVDEMLVISNNNPVRKLSTSGYWDHRAICTQLINASESADNNSRPLNIRAAGTIERTSFSIDARSKAEALKQCYAVAKNLSSVDQITLAVGNNGVRNLSTAGYWTGPLNICNQIMQVIDTSIL